MFSPFKVLNQVLHIETQILYFQKDWLEREDATLANSIITTQNYRKHKSYKILMRQNPHMVSNVYSESVPI